MAWRAVFFSSLHPAGQVRASQQGRAEEMLYKLSQLEPLPAIPLPSSSAYSAPAPPRTAVPFFRHPLFIPPSPPCHPPTHLHDSFTTSATGAQRRTAPSLTAASGPTHWLTSCAASQACWGTAWKTASWAALVAADRWAAILREMAEASSCSSTCRGQAGRRGRQASA